MQPTTPKTAEPLSTTHHNGHTIERFPKDVLRITRTNDRTNPPTADEAKTAAAWYWAHIGQRGNDPIPREANDK